MTQLLNSPGKRRGLAVGIVLLASVAAFGSLIYWNSTPDYQVLFSNLSQEDAGEMVAKLKEKRIPFELSPGGTSILVPKEKVYDVRLALAAEGARAAGPGAGRRPGPGRGGLAGTRTRLTPPRAAAYSAAPAVEDLRWTA